jgi:hypothetical protein
MSAVPVVPVVPGPSFFSPSRKAFVAAGVAAVATGGTALTGILADGKIEASHLVSQLETLMNGMLNKATLLDLVRHFIVFEKSKKEDPVTKQISISTVKKLAAYHQYYAVNAAVISTLRPVDRVEDEREGRMLWRPQRRHVSRTRRSPRHRLHPNWTCLRRTSN